MNRSEPVLVKLRASEHFITVRTVTRRRKSPWSFDLLRRQFAELESTGRIVVKDGYSFAVLALANAGSQVRIDFTWVSPYGDGAFNGFTQTVVLDYASLSRFVHDSLEEDGPRQYSMLYVDRTRSRPRLDFSAPGTQRTIRDVLSVPVLRHKLTRAVRDNFQWRSEGNHVVRFYADCDQYGFFRESVNGRDGLCGGLILHRCDGLEKARYSVHT